MATQRMIQSTIWEDEFVGSLSFFERCLWIGLFSRCADDQGRMPDKPILIKSQVFPYDTVGPELIAVALENFEAAGKIIRYSVAGRDLIQIVKWWENQNPGYTHESKFPGPPDWTDYVRQKQGSGYVNKKVITWPPAADHMDEGSKPNGYPDGSQEGIQKPPMLGNAMLGHVMSGIGEDLPLENELSGSPPQPKPAPQEPAPPPLNAAQKSTPMIAEWLVKLETAEAKNRPPILLDLFKQCYPGKDPPSYAWLGKIAKEVGGAGRLAELMWSNAARPPTGEVLRYLLRVAKGGNGAKHQADAENGEDYIRAAKRAGVNVQH